MTIEELPDFLVAKYHEEKVEADKAEHATEMPLIMGRMYHKARMNLIRELALELFPLSFARLNERMPQ